MTLIDIRTDEDLLDFKLELVLAGLFEQEDLGKEYTLTFSLRTCTGQYLQGLTKVYTPDVVRGFFTGRERMGEPELVRHILTDFLTERGYAYLHSVDYKLMDDAESLGIRTRAFEMGLAVHLLERCVSSEVLRYDSVENKRYFALND